MISCHKFHHKLWNFTLWLDFSQVPLCRLLNCVWFFQTPGLSWDCFLTGSIFKNCILKCEIFITKYTNKRKNWKIALIAETSFLVGQQKREHRNHERINRKWKTHFLKLWRYLTPNTQNLIWTWFTVWVTE